MQGGDLSRAEAMLFAQANALQAIFMSFSRLALTLRLQPNLEAFLRMRLKPRTSAG